MRRTLAATIGPAVAVSASWLLLEQPRDARALPLVLGLALVPALLPRWWQRALGVALACATMLWVSFEVKAWELVPWREERPLEPLLEELSHGVGDFYGVVLPFDPGRHAQMHALVLVAVFGFVAATALLVAARRPLAAAGVTVAGVCWPATLVSADTVAMGALALAAALAVLLVLRARSVRSLALGAVAASLVVTGSVWASNATTFAQRAVLQWESWDFRGLPAKALGVRFVWDANYDGVAFPETETLVLEIRGPASAQYWRASTLDVFTADRWLEDSGPHHVAVAEDAIPLDELAPTRASRRDGWMEQRIEVKALVDDRLVAAGTPVALSARSLGTVLYIPGGSVRWRRALAAGTRYRVWSYVPDPSPAALAAAPARYPSGSDRFLEVWARSLPPFGASRRDARVRALFGRYEAFGAYEPLYEQALRVAGGAETPYAAVLALESWFREEGGFRYEERPPQSFDVPPLVHFVSTTRAGYCQHYAGAMALMLRLLGVPARVAVGFTSGTKAGDTWRVTDHNAHAWVEVWFPGHGWVAFDPTPGRGTFSGIYSFASENAQAVAALGRGELQTFRDTNVRGFTEREAGTRPFVEQRGRPSLFGVAVGLATLVSLGIGSGKWLGRRLRYVTGDPRRSAAATRRELEAFLRDQGVAVPASATLEDLGRAVADELGVDGTAFATAAARGRFGPPDEVARAAATARAELRTLLRVARRELSLAARLRGFVSLRSLRGEWQA